MESPHPLKCCFLIFLLLYSFLGYSSKKTSTTLTIYTCVKDLSELINEIGERYSPPLPRAAGEYTRKPRFLHKKAYKSKNKSNVSDFLDIPQCCGSGSGIRCLFGPWIRDLE
jgi:hypothetical protein